jgi:isopenicillin-N epimerase
MKLNRRNFLISASAAVTSAAAVSVMGNGSYSITAGAGRMTSWEAVREQFDQLSRDAIHLSSFFLVSHPRPVREAIEKYRQAIDSDPFTYLEKNLFGMPAKIQAAAAEYLGGTADEVALTNSTTMGLAFIYQGLPLNAGQEILTTAHDHFVHHESIRLAAERAGATVRKVALFDDIKKVSADEIVERIKRAITPKTRVVGITWVHSSTGLKLPVREISDAVAALNKGRAESDRMFLVVDGVHGFGIEDQTVAELGVDFFIAGTHKWIFGPRGTGIVWAKADNWKKLRLVFPAFAPEPFIAWMSGAKTEALPQASWITPGGFHAFEYAWALPTAFAFHRQIGRAKIAARIHDLNDRCKVGLASMPRVKLHTPLGNRLSSGLIAFEIDGVKSTDVVKRLHEKRIIASTAPYRESYARLAPSLVNSPEEIEITLRHIRALAGS